MMEAEDGWGRGHEAKELSLGAIQVIPANQREPGKDEPFRKITLSQSYGQWIRERARKEAGKIRKGKGVMIQMMD